MGEEVETLTANTSALGGSGAISYQCTRDGTTLIGTNNNAYILQPADLGYTINVTVTRTGNYGSVTSNPTAVVAVELKPTPGLTFELINNNTAYLVSRGTATDSDVVIPDIHEGLPVTEIPSFGFSAYTNMTSITIGNRVVSIGSFAFTGCSSLETITISFVGATLNGTVNTHFGYIFGAASNSGQNSSIPASL